MHDSALAKLGRERKESLRHSYFRMPSSVS
jgi:hypothetical protein